MVTNKLVHFTCLLLNVYSSSSCLSQAAGVAPSNPTPISQRMEFEKIDFLTRPYASAEVGKLLEEIYRLNKDASLNLKIKRALDISIAQEDFVQQSLAPETELQKKIVQDTRNDPKTNSTDFMLSGHVVGGMLKLVSDMVKAKRILDIGMYTGYSAVTVGELPQTEEVVALEIEPYMETFVKERIKGTVVENKLRVIIAPAAESLLKLKQEGASPFDLVYIDADKPNYINYYKLIMENGLLSQGGVILCDNIFWFNTFFEKNSKWGEVQTEFTEFVKNDMRVDQIILPLRDGLLLIKSKTL